MVRIWKKGENAESYEVAVSGRLGTQRDETQGLQSLYRAGRSNRGDNAVGFLVGLKISFFVTCDRWGTGKCLVGTDRSAGHHPTFLFSLPDSYARPVHAKITFDYTASPPV